MKQVATIVLLCGEIASGKTTYAKHYQATHPGTIILSVDEWMLNLLPQCPGRKEHVAMEEKVLRGFYELSLQLLEAGMDVIIDHGYWIKQQRAEAIAFFQSHHCSLQLRYFPIEEEEQKKRLRKRNATALKGKQYVISEEQRVWFHTLFEQPDESIWQVVID